MFARAETRVRKTWENLKEFRTQGGIDLFWKPGKGEKERIGEGDPICRLVFRRRNRIKYWVPLAALG